MSLRVLIADDELLARKRLHRLLSAFDDVELVGECEDGAAVLAAVRQAGGAPGASGDTAIDVVLLDIDMPGLSGVEAMQLWPAQGPAIVFTTAHAQHAVEAFAGGAVDYVLKPIDAARLRQALDRVRGRRAPTAAGRVALATRKGVILLAPTEILCACIDGASVRLDTDRGPVFTDLSLADLEARLGDALRRVHRQALLNLSRVDRFEDNGAGGYLAHTDGGPVVQVSRKVARQLRREWGL